MAVTQPACPASAVNPPIGGGAAVAEADVARASISPNTADVMWRSVPARPLPRQKAISVVVIVLTASSLSVGGRPTVRTEVVALHDLGDAIGVRDAVVMQPACG
jgi:hypothetical protein